MGVLDILIIAVGLSMDAVAVSVASGIAMKDLKIRHAVLIAGSFGLFQAVMPLVGWFAGLTLKDFIAGIDHWIAFGLLLLIGMKMIYESFRMEEMENGINVLDVSVLFLLSLATSIDALAVGLSFAFLNITIAAPATIIGIVTFLLSFLGVLLGDRLGKRFEGKIGIAGGLILIAIGTKILLEHMGFL